jgi:dimethylamine/trimethylamine dehydrogenase
VTRALGHRGYRVLLAEAEGELGGRVTREAALPGLSEWARVRDYRVQQIQSMANVETYLGSAMQVDDVLAVAADHIVIATGARWRADGVARFNETPLTEFGPPTQIFTPDDIMAGRVPTGPTVVYDDDHYYMGSVLAERIRAEGVPVTLVTPETKVCAWGDQTSEQMRTHRRLIELGVYIITAHGLTAYDGRHALLCCIYTGRVQRVATEAVVTVTARNPDDALFRALQRRGTGAAARSLVRIGDCEAPAIIAGAVFSGHRYARELDTIVNPDNRIKYDRVFFEGG